MHAQTNLLLLHHVLIVYCCLLLSVAMSKQRSPVWDYFKVGEDSKYSICNSCDESISHGGKTTKTFNTTNLVYHTKSTHTDLHSECKKKCKMTKRAKEKAAISSSSSRQLMLQESLDKMCKWDISDLRALHIHTRIGETIAPDYQPFSIVDDVGFVCFSIHWSQLRYVYQVEDIQRQLCLESMRLSRMKWRCK